MPVKYRTMRGLQLDVGSIVAKNLTKPTYGNAGLNVRGDKIDSNGIVLKTQEQIEEEWRKNKEKQAATAGVSQNIKEPLRNVAPVITKQDPALLDKEFEPSDHDIQENPAPVKRRKIIDAE